MALGVVLKRLTVRSNPLQTIKRSHLSSPKLPSDLVLHIFQLAIDPLTLDRRLYTLAIFTLVFAASRSWAQQALVEKAQVDSSKRVKQLRRTLLARPDLAWSVKSLRARTKGGRAEVEAISRLLLACPVLEELTLEGPAQIPTALLTVASLNTSSLHRLSLADIVIQSSPHTSTPFRRLSRLGSAPAMSLQLPSIRQRPEHVFTSLVDLFVDIDDHVAASNFYANPDFLRPLASQLRSVSIHYIKNMPLHFLASCTSLQLLSIPLQSLNALFGIHLPPRPRILRLTDDPSAPCSNEVYSVRIACIFRTPGEGEMAVSALQMLSVPDAKERDFWGERVLAEMRYEAGVRGVRVVEVGSLSERTSEEQFWDLCDEVEWLGRRKEVEEAMRGAAL